MRATICCIAMRAAENGSEAIDIGLVRQFICAHMNSAPIRLGPFCRYGLCRQPEQGEGLT
jgi:hypothetical protein